MTGVPLFYNITFNYPYNFTVLAAPLNFILIIMIFNLTLRYLFVVLFLLKTEICSAFFIYFFIIYMWLMVFSKSA